MLTIEQHIAQMKKKDKLDEFNFMNHAENIATVMKYAVWGHGGSRDDLMRTSILLWWQR
jgi:hypothetical protein